MCPFAHMHVIYMATGWRSGVTLSAQKGDQFCSWVCFKHVIFQPNPNTSAYPECGIPCLQLTLHNPLLLNFDADNPCSFH